MDGDRFDRMTRGMLAGASRRSLLAGIIAGAAATVVAAEALDAKNGKGKGRGNGNGKGKGGGKGKGKNGKRTICHCPGGNPNNCQTITVGKKAAESHLKNHCDYAGECRDDVVNPCEPDSECLAVIDTEGDAARESDGRYTLSTEGGNDDAGFGNLVFGVPAGTTFADLESIVADYDFAEDSDTCGGGSPRFVVRLENGKCPYVQFPPGADCADGDGTTGNLIGNNEEFVWNDDLCGGDQSNSTYAEVLADYATVEVTSITLVVDESPTPADTEKTVTVDVCISLASS